MDESWFCLESLLLGWKFEDRFYFKNDVDMVRVVLLLLLEEDFELDEGFLFVNEGENIVCRVNVVKNDLFCLVLVKKLYSGILKVEFVWRECEWFYLICLKVNVVVLI